MDLQKAKSLFFLQYAGQPVMYHKEVPDIAMVPEYALVTDELGKLIHNINDSYLILRIVNQLTDEELEMAKNFRDKHKRSILPLLGVIDDFTYLDNQNKPVTLSPEQIINLGWAVVDNGK